MTSLSIRNVSKLFGSVTTVDNVDLEIPAGKFICLLGPSGCGKTSLLRLIAGLEQPTLGQIFVGGQDQVGLPAHRRDFGMVFQSLALFPHMTVAENIEYPLRIRGAKSSSSAPRVAELLELIRLPDAGNRRIDQLSGGQRQRVAIARALAIEPSLFLLDEPLSALDAKLREHMQIELSLLQKSLGITTIVVTHDQREAMTMADLVVVMERGRVLQAASPIEIYRSPANSFVAGFIGTSNLIDCRRTGAGTVALFEREFPIPRAGAMPAGGKGQVMLSVRPEDVVVEPDPEQGELQGTVEFIRDLGSSVEVHVAIHGTTILSVTPPKDRPEVMVGQQVGITLHTDRAAITEL